MKSHPKTPNPKNNIHYGSSSESNIVDENQDMAEERIEESPPLLWNGIEELMKVVPMAHPARIAIPPAISKLLKAEKLQEDQKKKEKEEEKNRKALKARERKKKQALITGEHLLEQFYDVFSPDLKRNFLKKWALKRLALSKKNRTRFLIALTEKCARIKDITYQWEVDNWSIYYFDRRPAISELVKTCNDGFVPTNPAQNSLDILKLSLANYLIVNNKSESLGGQDVNSGTIRASFPSQPNQQPIDPQIATISMQTIDRRLDISSRIAALIRESTITFEDLVTKLYQAKDDEGLGYVMDKMEAVKAIINIIHRS